MLHKYPGGDQATSSTLREQHPRGPVAAHRLPLPLICSPVVTHGVLRIVVAGDSASGGRAKAHIRGDHAARRPCRPVAGWLWRQRARKSSAPLATPSAGTYGDEGLLTLPREDLLARPRCSTPSPRTRAANQHRPTHPQPHHPTTPDPPTTHPGGEGSRGAGVSAAAAAPGVGPAPAAATTATPPTPPPAPTATPPPTTPTTHPTRPNPSKSTASSTAAGGGGGPSPPPTAAGQWAGGRE